MRSFVCLSQSSVKISQNPESNLKNTCHSCPMHYLVVSSFSPFLLCKIRVYFEFVSLLHCAPAAAQCIVIGPVCLFVCVWVGL